MCEEIPQYLEQACEDIDAGVFSGEVLYQPAQIKHLKQYVGRWQRAIAQHEAIQSDKGGK